MKKILILLLFSLLIIKQNLNAKNLSDFIELNKKDYVGKLLNGSDFIVKIDGKVIIDNVEYECLKVTNKIDTSLQIEGVDRYYDLSGITYFNYEHYLYLKLLLEGEGATGFHIIIDYKNKNIIMNRKFILNTIKEIIGFNNLFIFLCLERIEIFDLEEERFKYQLFLKDNIKGADTRNDGLNIKYKSGKEEYFTYIDLSKLNNNPKYVSPRVDNLRIRYLSSTYSKIIRNLKKGEKLILLEKGRTETINETKGTWVKVKTEKGEIGWCFDAYLEELK